MSDSTEIVPQGGTGGRGRPARRIPASNDDMPPALLEFHSPSAAMAAMPPTASARYITWIVSSMSIAGLLVMALFPIDKVVTTPGALVSTEPTIVVQPLEAAIIRTIDVREGDSVRKGQVLAHLDPTLSNADLGNLRKQTQSLQAEVDRLTAEVSGKDYAVDPANPDSTQQGAIFLRRKNEYAFKLSNYNQQISGLQNQLVGYRASAALYAGRVRVAANVRDMRVELQKDQVGSRLQSLGSQDELMEIERSQVGAQQDAAATNDKLNALISERDGYVQGSKAESYQSLTDAQRKLAEATGDLEKATLTNGLLVMKAPRDAIVLNIAHVSVGSVVTAAQQFMTLTPTDSPLDIEARMSADEAGFVKLGDKAQVKFQTFPYVQYGGANATVVNISSDAFSEEGAQAGIASAPANGLSTPGGPGTPFYRVRMRIDGYTLHSVPSYFKPTAGMIVSSDINVGRRTVLQYLLSSVVPTLTEGMRDPS